MSIDPLFEEPEAGSEVYPHSTNISDYVFPTSIDRTSDLESTGDIALKLGDGTGGGGSAGNPAEERGSRMNGIGGSGTTVKTITVYLRKVGLPTGNIQCEIFNAIFGGTRPSGAPVANGISGTLDVSTLTAIYTKITFTFAIAPSADSNYWMILHYTGGNNANYVEVRAFSRASVDNPVWALNALHAGDYFNVDANADIEFLGRDPTGVKFDSSGATQPASLAIDGNTATYWQSVSELNPFLRGTHSTIADKEPSAVAVYVDKSKLTGLQILIQTSLNALAWTTKRTINISQLTDLAYNFIRFNRDVLPIRYIRVITSDSIERIFSISEYKALIPTTTQWADRQSHKTISPTSTSVGLAG